MRENDFIDQSYIPPQEEGEFFSREQFYDSSFDAGMGMSQEFSMRQMGEVSQLIHERYGILSHFPENHIYGQFHVDVFADELIDSVKENGIGTLQIIGESLSGKSFTSSQFGSLMLDVGIQPIYVPWVDVIRDARKIGVIEKDRAFGELTKDEFSRTTRLYQTIHEALLSAGKESGVPTCVIGETIGIPVIDPAGDRDDVYLDRGTTAIRDLVEKQNAYVAAVFASGGVRRSGKDFRSNLEHARTSDEVAAAVAKFGIEVHETDPEKIMEALKRSGAPVGVAAKIEDQVSHLLITLANKGVIDIPNDKRDIDVLREKQYLRARYIGEQLFPFLLDRERGSDLSVPPDRTFIGYNRKIQGKVERFNLNSIHYHRILDVIDLDTLS